MTREEAIIDLKAKITRIKLILDEGLCANPDRWATKLKWHEDMLFALLSPQPDPITGLDTDTNVARKDPVTGLVPCQYCNGNHETHEVMPSDPDTIWTIMTDRQQLSFINCNWGCEDHVVDINYCPMCGRKLRVAK